MTKSKVKALFISFLLAAVAVCLSLAFVACKGDDKDGGNYGVGEEGVYYYDKDASTEYLMSLQSGTYMISAEGEKGYAGTYSYDESDKSISFKTDGGESFSASFSDDAMQLAIENTPYTFLKKVNYTVTFVDGSTSTTQSVTYGRQATAPEKDESRIFIGWFTDSAFTSSYKFDTAVTGDMTLYAYYIDIDATIANYDVTFVDGGETVYETKTQNGVVYDIPDYDGILGWWVSDTNDEDSLTYKYEGQVLNEATNLFAVKEGSLGVSVYEDKITWEATVSSVSITVDGVNVTPSATGNSFAYDFSSLGTGAHEVLVRASGYGDENLVYVVNGLARVSNFSVYGDVLIYNAVKNAQYYYISVSCGNSSHDHTMIYNGNTLTYDFSNCEMGPDGISFTVYAYANGYVESVSETFVYALILDGTTVSIDKNTDTAMWTAVDDATGYEVYIGVGSGDCVYVETVTRTEYSLKYYDIDTEIKFFVKPVAPGYYSENSEEISYTKATLRTPEITGINEYTVSWSYVDGASNYIIYVNGKQFETVSGDITSTSYDFMDDPNFTQADSYVITVRAVNAGNTNQNSQLSDEVIATDSELAPLLVYEDGVVYWQYAMAAGTYYVSINEGDETAVEGKNSFNVTFTQSGENIIKVYFTTDEGESAVAQLSVTAYAVIFDSRGGKDVETMYVAKGDTLILEDLTSDDYVIGTAEFKGWYTLPDLSNDENASKYAGDGVEVVSGSTFDYNGTVILYAFWINQKISVTLNAGDGYYIVGPGTGTELGSTVTESISFNSKTFTLPVPEDPNELSFFLGWYTSETGGVQYTDEYGNALVLYNNTNVTTLYAHWGEAIAVSIVDSPVDGTSVLEISKGSEISRVTGGKLTVKSEYTIGGQIYTVAVVGSNAFVNCTSLVEINLPDTIQYISTTNNGYVSGSGAFAGCSKLQAVNIYATGVEGDEAVREIYYYSVGGVLFSKNTSDDGVTLIYYPHAKTGTEYQIPSSVSNDTEYTLEGANAVKVEGHAVTAIAAQAFSAGTSATVANLPEITKINVPSTVTTINSQAFYNNTKLTEIVFQADDDGKTAEVTFGTGVFANCTVLTSVSIPSTMTSFDADIFSGCTALTTVTVVGTEGNYSSADNMICTDGGTTIIFCPIGRKGEITTGTTITKINDKAFYGCVGITKVTFGSAVTYIGESAFEGCTGVKEVVFVDGTLEESTEYAGGANAPDLTIKTRAFYGLTNRDFTTVKLPQNLTVLEAYAFANCTYLTTVYFDARSGSDSTSFTFATNAFATVSGLATVTTLYLGPNVPAFGFTGVFGKKLENIIIDESNNNFSTDDSGITYDADKKSILNVPDTIQGVLTLPDTLETIGDQVFSGKTGLTGIIIPASVTNIGYQAFYQCSSLSFVEFDLGEGDSLVIGDYAFGYCTSLTSVTLPSRLTMMGAYDTSYNLTSFNVFYGCSALETINVADGCEAYTTEYGVLYMLTDGEITDLIMSPVKNSADGGELVIPETVTKIWDKAFYNNGGVTKISFENDNAVYGMELGADITGYSSVEEIILPTGLTELSYGCFEQSSSLVYVYVPYTVTEINYKAFYQCTSLVTVEFGETPEGVSESELKFVGTGTEAGYDFSRTAIVELVLPERTTLLQEYTFTSMEQLEKITIGSQITEIPANCFYYCTSLKEVVFEGGEDSKLTKIADYAFLSTGSLKIEMPENLEEIGKYAFGNYYESQYRDFAASNIVSVKFNAKLGKIDDYAFYKCTYLTTIEFADAETVDTNLGLTIGAYAFSDVDVTTLTIPYYVTEIGGFDGATKLETVNFADGETLYVYGDGDNGVEGHTIKITDYAFSGCTSLKVAAVPAYVSSIGDFAFYGCSSLATVTFGSEVDTLAETSVASMLTSIGASAFCGCTSITSIVLPETLETLGDNAFNGCTGITSITIPAGTKSIGASAFSGCTSLASVTFAEEGSVLESIGSYAFAGTALTEFAFPEVNHVNGITLGDALFKGCDNLTKVTLSNGVVSLGTALSDCSSITGVEVSDTNNNYALATDGSNVLYNRDYTEIVYVIGDITGDMVIGNVTAIADDLFKDQTGLSSVTIPATVVSIGSNAFNGCTSLATVTFTANTDGNSALATVGDGAFSGCTSLTSFTLPSSVSTLGKGVFQNDTQLSTFTFGTDDAESSSLTTLGTYAFYGCTALTAITIPQSVSLSGASTASDNEKILSYDFNGCTGLTSVKFLGVPDMIGGYAFSGCTSLKTVSFNGATPTDGTIDLSPLPANTRVGDYAFAGTAVENVILGCNDYASNSTACGTFRGCTSLKGVTCTENSSAGIILVNGMFSGCTGLETVVLRGSDVTIMAGSSAGSASTVTTYGVFNGCTSLKSVVIGLAEVKACTFYDCAALETVAQSENDLTSMEGIADLRQNLSATTAPDYAFYGCSALKSVILPDQCLIGTYTFYGCTALSTMTNVTNYTANKYEDGVADLSGVTSVAREAFDGCEKIETIIISPTVTLSAGTSDYYGAFGNTGVKTVLVTEGESYSLSLTHSTFKDCESLTTFAYISDSSYKTENGMTVLDEDEINTGVIDLTRVSTIAAGYVFSGCKAITAIYINSSVTSLSNATYMFSGCEELETIAAFETGAESNWTYDESSVTKGVVDLSNVTSLTSATYLFSDCAKIEKVVIPSNLVNLYNGMFSGCSALTTVVTDKSLLNNTQYEGVVDLSNLTSTANTTYVFQNCEKIEKVLFSPTAATNRTTLAEGFFDGCTSLSTVATDSALLLGEGYMGTADLNSFTTLKDYVFRGTGIVNLVLGGGEYTFAQGSASPYAAATPTPDPDTYTGSGYKSQFYGCKKLETVVFTAVIPIDAAMFADCTSLKTVTYGTGIQTLAALPTPDPDPGEEETGVFQIVPGTSATVGDSAGAFAGCTALTTFALPVEEIPAYTFYGCNSLASIVVPSADIGTVTITGTYAFGNCSQSISFYYAGTSGLTVTVSGTTGNTAVTNATIYYYSETEPDDAATGNYWHYGDDGEIAVWGSN